MGIPVHEDYRRRLPIFNCRSFQSVLRSSCVQCHFFSIRTHSVSSFEDESDWSDIDDIDDQQIIILAVRRWARKSKHKRKDGLTCESLTWVLSPRSGELFIAPKGVEGSSHKLKQDSHKLEQDDDDHQETESFYSAMSYLTSSSVAKEVDYRCIPNRELLEAFRRCEGWPFGLYRKSVILPPLPQSPSESWSWCRSRIAKMI